MLCMITTPLQVSGLMCGPFLRLQEYDITELVAHVYNLVRLPPIVYCARLLSTIVPLM